MSPAIPCERIWRQPLSKTRSCPVGRSVKANRRENEPAWRLMRNHRLATVRAYLLRASWQLGFCWKLDDGPLSLQTFSFLFSFMNSSGPYIITLQHRSGPLVWLGPGPSPLLPWPRAGPVSMQGVGVMR